MFRTVSFFVVSLIAASLARGDILESFESPEPTWQFADSDCALQKLQHVRTFEHSYSGTASEHFKFLSSRGTYVHLAQPIKPTRIPDELSVSIWVNSNRPGAQLMALVVLPPDAGLIQEAASSVPRDPGLHLSSRPRA